MSDNDFLEAMEQVEDSAAAELARLRAANEALTAELANIQELSSHLTAVEGELADHADDGGQDDDPAAIQLRGTMYKLRRQLSAEIFASRALSENGATHG
jgi:hypothetical protein